MVTRTATPKPSARIPGILSFIGAAALQFVSVPYKKTAKKVKPGPKPNTKPNERAFRRAVRSFPCCPIFDPRTSENISPRTKITQMMKAPSEAARCNCNCKLPAGFAWIPSILGPCQDLNSADDVRLLSQTHIDGSGGGYPYL